MAFRIIVKFSDGYSDIVEVWDTRAGAERAIKSFYHAAEKEGTWTVTSATIEEIEV